MKKLGGCLGVLLATVLGLFLLLFAMIIIPKIPSAVFWFLLLGPAPVLIILLVQRARRPKYVSVPLPINRAPLMPVETEQSLKRKAFSLLQQRITDSLCGCYPEARWIWETPTPLVDIIAGKRVYIMLNRAGGFRKAEVVVHQIQFVKLCFDTVPPPRPHTDIPTDDATENSGKTDYSLLAFDWVFANTIMLNNMSNDAIGTGKSSFVVTASTLPVREGWEDICAELELNGFAKATVIEDGIEIRCSTSAERE